MKTWWYLFENALEKIGIQPFVLIIEMPKSKNAHLNVLNVDSNLPCALNFFKTNDRTYENCGLILGFRKKRE